MKSIKTEEEDEKEEEEEKGRKRGRRGGIKNFFINSLSRGFVI